MGFRLPLTCGLVRKGSGNRGPCTTALRPLGTLDGVGRQGRGQASVVARKVNDGSLHRRVPLCVLKVNFQALLWHWATFLLTPHPQLGLDFNAGTFCPTTSSPFEISLASTVSETRAEINHFVSAIAPGPQEPPFFFDAEALSVFESIQSYIPVWWRGGIWRGLTNWRLFIGWGTWRDSLFVHR